MNKYLILSLLLGLVLPKERAVDCDDCFNILSLDGGRYNGLITARFVSFIE